jgi:hypothetical protein
MDTGFLPPSVSVNTVWVNPNNVFLSDNSYANANTAGDLQKYSTFGFSVPSGATINGIEVDVEAHGALGGETLRCYLSGNAGSTWSAVKGQTFNAGADQVQPFGNATSTWTYSWTSSSFSNANFMMRLITPNGGESVLVDNILAKVYYTPTTAIKNISGVAKASISKVAGVAIASVSKVGGLA